MKPKLALIIILILAFTGLLFSAYFAYYDTWGSGCKETIISCPEEGNSFVSDTPICLYGMVINLLIIVMSLLGLLKTENGDQAKSKPKPQTEKKDLEDVDIN